MSSLLPHLAVHGTHHKMGTVWMETSIQDICKEFKLKLQLAPNGVEQFPVKPSQKTIA